MEEEGMGQAMAVGSRDRSCSDQEAEAPPCHTVLPDQSSSDDSIDEEQTVGCHGKGQLATPNSSASGNCNGAPPISDHPPEGDIV